MAHLLYCPNHNFSVLAITLIFEAPATTITLCKNEPNKSVSDTTLRFYLIKTGQLNDIPVIIESKCHDSTCLKLAILDLFGLKNDLGTGFEPRISVVRG